MTSESIPPPLDAPLPRGRHTLHPDTVRAHQRARLLAAAAQALVEVGYWPLTVADIASRAGVSRATLYVHFKDKGDCLRAAQAHAADCLIASIEGVCAAAPGWPRDVIAALRAALEFSLSAPHQAMLLTIEPTGVDQLLAAQIAETNRLLAAMLRAAAERGGHPSALPELTERALIGGTGSAIATALKEQPQIGLEQLGPQLAEFILLPYLGPARARRFASLPSLQVPD